MGSLHGLRSASGMAALFLGALLGPVDAAEMISIPPGSLLMGTERGEPG